MKIAIGNDHVALDMKNHIKEYLAKGGIEVTDFGAYTDENAIKIDYIFTNLPVVEGESFAVPDPHEDGIYISDHRPVMASLIIE